MGQILPIILGMSIQIKERVNIDIGYEYRWGNDVNGSSFGEFDGSGVDGTQDVSQFRILASCIVYF